MWPVGLAWCGGTDDEIDYYLSADVQERCVGGKHSSPWKHPNRAQSHRMDLGTLVKEVRLCENWAKDNKQVIVG